MTKKTSEFIRKLEYLSKYRGCKESEIIFSRFVERYLHQLSIEELMDYEIFLQNTDAEILDWIMYHKEPPINIKNNKVYKLALSCIEI